MSNYYTIIGVSSGGEMLQNVGVDEGIRVVPIEMTRKITPIKDLIGLLKLYRLFRTEKPFIVHTHTPKAGTLGMIAAKLAGIPNRLHTIAGMPLVEAKGYKRIVLNWVEKITYRCATKIYPNSKGLNTIILEHRFTKPSKLMVLGNGSSNGIDTSYFDPDLYSPESKKKLRDSLKIGMDDFVFIYVGRLVTDKGINELINAFQGILSGHKKVKLLLVGTFEKELDPLQKKTESFIWNSKDLIGVGWQKDVRPYFSISDCLVFPSYREGFPNVVMQAGAMGLYTIVTDINGCNEIITNEVNGTIIPPKDADALRKAMEDCLENKQALKSVESTCRIMIKERYEREFVWQELLKEYRDLELGEYV